MAIFLAARKLADQFVPEVQPLFNGTPTDRAAYVRIGGAVIILLGVIRFLWKRQ